MSEKKEQQMKRQLQTARNINYQETRRPGELRRSERAPKHGAGFGGAYRLFAFLAALGIAAGGCTTTHYRGAADRETYAIISEKAPLVPNMEPEFTIEQPELPALDGLPKLDVLDEALGDAAAAEMGGGIVSLEEALALAVQHNRTYQNQKEALYLAALGLTLDRHQYTPTFSAGASADYNRSTTDRDKLSAAAAIAQAAPDVIRDVGDLAGAPADLINQYAALVQEAARVAGIDQPTTEIVNERSVSGRTAISADWLLKGGGRIAVDLTSNFLRYLTGDPRVSTSSALIGDITQPLLRGAGRKAAAERLTQAERDVLYALRDYTRFRKEFTVQIVTAYYNVLRSRDVVRNNYQSYLAFKQSVERDRALVSEGRRKKSDLGRIQQAELNARNNWTTSVRRYKQNLDNFKIQLGLPVEANIVLDQDELAGLKEAGIRDWDISSEDAVKVALFSRLDLYNARDELEDAARRVEVAANSLKPDLDLVLAGSVDSKPGDRFQELDFQRARWSAGLDLALPLDRKSERNNYRAALIDLERTDRELELAVDNVKLEVRDALRNLEQAKQVYEIRQIGVGINEERVEEEGLLAELGKGDALNLVDAQNDLTAARNDLTNALVDHTIARLEFWRDMGILFIKEGGQWQEPTNEVEPETLAQTSLVP